MSGLTKRNFLATLIVIAGLSASLLGWIYVPLVVWPVIPLLGFLGVAVFLTLYPASPAPAYASAVRGPAGGGAAARGPSGGGGAAARGPSGGGGAAARGPSGGGAASRGPAARRPGDRLAAASAAPGPGRRDQGRDAGPRLAARGSGRRSGPQALPPLPPDAVVALTAEREAAGVDEVITGLDRKLIGLVPVKAQFEQIASLLVVDRARRRFGLHAQRPNLHMCFTGDPGTGKTTVALQMAELLYRLGYLESTKIVHAMRDDLVGEYIGQTAPKTKWVLERAMGGVLFIDEAYSLFRPSDPKDYGQECVEILLQVMENERDRLVVILAGYKDRMDVFFESNPGMSSRIAHHLDFAPYTLDELMAIGQLMLADASYYLSEQAEVTLREQLSLRMHQPRFANARSVRNDLERARLRHAHRLALDPELTRTMDDLMRLEPADVLLNGAAG
jgi:probable Rubsico expression protein CbbX